MYPHTHIQHIEIYPTSVIRDLGDSHLDCKRDMQERYEPRRMGHWYGCYAEDANRLTSPTTHLYVAIPRSKHLKA